MSFIKTLDLMNAVKTAVEAVKLDDGITAAFAKVERYAHENLLAALRDLFIFDNRVCLIVPTAIEHESRRDGMTLHVKRITELGLIIADRSHAIRNFPLIGSDRNPGTLQLADAVIKALTGQSLGFADVALEPGSGQPLHVTEKDRKAEPGREAWVQTFKTIAGYEDINLPRPSGRPRL